MKCRRLWQVEASRDGRLSREEADRFERHAQACADCIDERAALEQLRASLRSASPALDDMAARRMRQRVLEGVDALVTQRAPAARKSRVSVALLGGGARTRIAAILAAVVALVGAGWVVRSRAPLPSDEPSIVIVPGAKGAQWSRTTTPTEERVELVEGTLHLNVRRTRDQRRVIVVVPDGEIEDIGTSFDVSVERGRTSSVHVSEGRVVVHAVGRDAVDVAAGSTWEAPQPPSPVDVVAAPPPTVVVSDERRHGANDASRSQRAPVVARAAVAAPATRVDPGSTPAASEADDEDAAYLNVVALAREGRNEEARIAAKTYLRKYPNGFRRVEVQALAR